MPLYPSISIIWMDRPKLFIVKSTARAKTLIRSIAILQSISCLCLHKTSSFPDPDPTSIKKMFRPSDLALFLEVKPGLTVLRERNNVSKHPD